MPKGLNRKTSIFWKTKNVPMAFLCFSKNQKIKIKNQPEIISKKSPTSNYIFKNKKHRNKNTNSRENFSEINLGVKTRSGLKDFWNFLIEVEKKAEAFLETEKEWRWLRDLSRTGLKINFIKNQKSPKEKSWVVEFS